MNSEEKEKQRERMRSEDRKRAKELWVYQLIAIGWTKEEAELDYEKKHRTNPL